MSRTLITTACAAALLAVAATAAPSALAAPASAAAQTYCPYVVLINTYVHSGPSLSAPPLYTWYEGSVHLIPTPISARNGFTRSSQAYEWVQSSTIRRTGGNCVQ